MSRACARLACAGVLITVLVVAPAGVVHPAAATPSCGVTNCSTIVGAAASATGLIPGIGAVSGVIGGVTSELAGQLSSIASGMLDQIGRGIADAVSSLLTEVSKFLTASTRPDVTAASFVGQDGAYHKVAQVAAALMVLFLFFAVAQGTLAGEPGQMIARIIRDTPLAVLAIFGLPWLVSQLLSAVDEICALILPTGATFSTIAQVYAADHIRAALGGFGIPAILCELFVFLGGIGVYAELVVRSALVTVVVALAPLSFAAMVWPAARAAARKVAELLGAIILSKLAIWVALAVGISLFASQGQHAVPSAGAWGQMISGAAILAVALFAPFVVWRLMPVAETALIAQGLSRQPGRAATQALYLSNAVGRFGRHGGGQGSGERHSAGGGGEAELPTRSLQPVGAATGGGPAGGAGGASAGGAAGGGAAAAGGGAAAAGIAGPASVAVAGGTAVRDKVISAGDAQTARNPAPPSGSGNWSFRGSDRDGRP